MMRQQIFIISKSGYSMVYLRQTLSNYSKLIVLFSAILLTACQSVGTQYKFPTAAEKSANFQPVDRPFLASLVETHRLYINNFNEEGCYSGRTLIDGPVKLRANEPITITYEASFSAESPASVLEEKSCQIFFRFTPRENAHYRVQTEINVSAAADTPGIKAGTPICRIMLQQVMNDGSVQPEPMVSLSLRAKKWACFKIQSKEEWLAEAKADEEADAREEAQDAAEEKAKEEAKAKAKAAAKTPVVAQ
ncbi:hypothetical protein [Paludibacterium purpuratum]|uniref:Uncharacterized protein n=1 Tax=Paludibacterium purpuratum TaxID=1144873 RepID=A0A4R7B171_9NEIS|nr:hypothetical protein [Paludibacterium purpuratum]TDR76431.1 hypothetical protein DFP86_11114 [Paludibacterium purpuratum]